MLKFSFFAPLVGLIFLFQIHFPTTFFGQNVAPSLHFLPAVVSFYQNIPTIIDTTIAICPGDLYQFGNTSYAAPNLIENISPDGDTLLKIHLVAQSQPTDTTFYAICPGQIVLVNGLFYTEAGIYLDTFPAKIAGACDSIATYIFTFKFQPTLNKTIQFCPSESVILAGKTYSFPGTIKLLLPPTTGNGCDTAATFTLEWLPEPTKNETISLCNGETIVLGGQTFSAPGIFQVNLPSTGGGCDTLATYQLKVLPFPSKTEKIQFCAGETVVLGGQNYSQSGTVKLTIASTTGGCDTIATYILEKLTNPTFSKTIQFCEGETVVLGGQNYSQSGTAHIVIASITGGCDTLATYFLEKLPQPIFSKTIEFCTGDTVVLGGQNHTQTATISLTIASTTGGCDTLATYFLINKTDGQNSTISMNCPSNITKILPAGTTSTTVNYNFPTANSDCTCPGLDLQKTGGGASGSTFLVGKNTVCWQAEDVCGSTKTCCFSINIEEESPCDVKTMSCLKWELLSIKRDAANNLVYRIRLTNRCTSQLLYTYFGIPQGMVAKEPAGNSIFMAASGRKYEVRNPNFSPVYGIRFKGKNPDLLNVGESDIFRFVLPPQVNPNFIYVAGRLENQLFEEWHLNTFYCPIGIESADDVVIKYGHPEIFDEKNISNERSDFLKFENEKWQLVPNPASPDALLRLDGPAILEADFLLFDISGRIVFRGKVIENQIDLQNQVLPTGLFFYKILENGQPAGSGKLVIGHR